ncbi:S-adenosyl-L-methionine-dependent methyltransferase [Aspergillus ambiguus]|uniref:S-adenosyl-L-methionine-dependent methyltransferase n=1 Tax=Aspergillus ambiguus TaxID=176160 RepID=UPI003CCD0B47
MKIWSNEENYKVGRSTFPSLGSNIADLSRSLAGQLESLNYPLPTFDINAPASLPLDPEIQDVRLKLLENIARLQHLVTGPSDFWFQESMFLNHELLTFDVFNNFKFWEAVPLNASASYAEIAERTNLPEQIVRRFLKMGFTLFVFAEEAPGSDRVVHTAASAHMVRSPFVRSFVAHCLEDVRPAATVGVEALRKWFMGREEAPEDVETCAWPLATDDGRQRGVHIWPFFDNFERHGQPKGFRAGRFAEAMQGLGETSGVMTETVLRKFDWGSLGEATVVDMGGSAGHISAMLAENYPKLDIVVQDLPSVESAFNANIGSSPYAPRIRFQSHDFFQTQTLSADVFLLKSVLHDWSDQYVLQIVRHLLDVLKPGNHLLIFDIVVPADYDAESKSATPLPVRKWVSAMDLQMHLACNSKERTVNDWVKVIQQADTRFEFKEAHVPAGSPLGIFDFVFQG